MIIGALAVDPQHPATVFAGTGSENSAASPGYTGVGLFRSRDQGDHWGRVGGSQFDGCAFTAPKIPPRYDRVMVGGGLPGSNQGVASPWRHRIAAVRTY